MGALDDGERVVARDAATWRTWLEANHATSKGAWLVRPRPGSDLELIDYEDAILQALCFGWIDGPVRSFDEQTGGLWFAPRRPSSGWAATNKARLVALEEAGLMAEAGIRAVELAKANGAWTILDNAEALREPDDLAQALDAAPVARERWDAFPPSSRKFGIAAVDGARRPETRAARIAKIVADAADGRRPQ
ncbi:YdeI/OmpD-associated family protein [Microbacterium deminutum]|uniref:YdeI/OmpD-associated family protein n=1 Tax=Microbacterium deminutum TaxID=344164 RepID=A0ABN2QSJ6_9MICO